MSAHPRNNNLFGLFSSVARSIFGSSSDAETPGASPGDRRDETDEFVLDSDSFTASPAEPYFMVGSAEPVECYDHEFIEIPADRSKNDHFQSPERIADYFRNIFDKAPEWIDAYRLDLASGKDPDHEHPACYIEFDLFKTTELNDRIRARHGTRRSATPVSRAPEKPTEYLDPCVFVEVTLVPLITNAFISDQRYDWDDVVFKEYLEHLADWETWYPTVDPTPAFVEAFSKLRAPEPVIDSFVKFLKDHEAFDGSFSRIVRRLVMKRNALWRGLMKWQGASYHERVDHSYALYRRRIAELAITEDSITTLPYGVPASYTPDDLVLYNARCDFLTRFGPPDALKDFELEVSRAWLLNEDSPPIRGFEYLPRDYEILVDCHNDGASRRDMMISKIIDVVGLPLASECFEALELCVRVYLDDIAGVTPLGESRVLTDDQIRQLVRGYTSAIIDSKPGLFRFDRQTADHFLEAFRPEDNSQHLFDRASGFGYWYDIERSFRKAVVRHNFQRIRILLAPTALVLRDWHASVCDKLYRPGGRLASTAECYAQLKAMGVLRRPESKDYSVAAVSPIEVPPMLMVHKRTKIWTPELDRIKPYPFRLNDEVDLVYNFEGKLDREIELTARLLHWQTERVRAQWKDGTLTAIGPMPVPPDVPLESVLYGLWHSAMATLPVVQIEQYVPRKHDTLCAWIAARDLPEVVERMHILCKLRAQHSTTYIPYARSAWYAAHLITRLRRHHSRTQLFSEWKRKRDGTLRHEAVTLFRRRRRIELEASRRAHKRARASRSYDGC